MTRFAGNGAIRTGYLRSASFFSLILVLYPIAWGCSEGGNVISPTSEMIFYGILDFFTGPLFLAFLLFHVSRVDYALFGLASGKYTDTVGGPTGMTKAQEAGVAQP